MTVKTHIFGHLVEWDEELETWFYNDTGEHYTRRRKCPQCDEYPTEEGYDPCIGKIEGAESVCCGHGIENGYVLWEIEDS